MKLSDGEKLILVMLSEIYKKLGIKHEIDPDLVLSSIFSNKAWGLRWEYSGLFSESQGSDPPEVKETTDILDMYRFIEASYKKLSPADQQKVKTQSAPFDDYVSYQGFDGNNDAHYGIVSYLVNDLGRYGELKGRDLNSHSIGTLPKYKKMLRAIQPIDPSRRASLTPNQLIEILKA